MAAPHVTGAVALYKASRPRATPAEVKAALRAAGTRDWFTSTDPDGVHEPLLNVAQIVALGDWTVDATSPPRPMPTGGTVQVPVYVIRAEDVTADVALSVDAPPGFGATLSAPIVGPDATTAALTVVVPPVPGDGYYTLRVHGAIGERHQVGQRHDQGGRRRPGHAGAPPDPGPRDGASTRRRTPRRSAGPPPRIPPARSPGTWPRSRSRVDPWGTLSTVGATTRSVERTIRVGPAYAIRVRAVDAAGNSSAWSEVSPLTSLAVQDGSDAMTRSGTWRRYANSHMSGGTTVFATSRGAWLRYAFTGRGLAVVMPYGPGRGKAQIWIDGSLAGTVDTYARSFLYRRVVLARSWASSGSHVVKVVALGTSGRPRVDVDAFLVIR